MSDELRYRFGPLEQRGLIIGMRNSQLGMIFVGVFLTIMAVHVIPGSFGIGAALFILVATAGGSFWHFAGRTPDQWGAILVRWFIGVFKHEQVYVSQSPLIGASWTTELLPDMPQTLKGISIIAAPVTGGELGVLKDAMNNSYSAVVSVRGKSFALLDQSDKGRILSQWADLLSGLAREGSPVTRVQWIERTVAESGETVGQYLRETVAAPFTSPAVRSYLQLVEEAGPVAQQHETFLVLQIDAMKARRSMKQAGGGDSAACTVLAREIYSFATRLQAAELEVLGLLTPRLLAQSIRLAYDPKSRNSIAMQGMIHPDLSGVSPAQAWPMKTVTGWDSFKTDSAVHATFWCAEWPRTDVGPDFLAPLLLQTWVHRTVSVTLEPVSPIRAQREVESARTADIADDEVRRKHGFLTTMRRQRQQENVVRREQELADGHADIRFSGYITVTAETPDELELACSEVEQQAGQSRILLRRMSGEQDVAFTYTLPMARGLK